MFLGHVTLRVSPTSWKRLREYYGDALGMSLRTLERDKRYLFQFGDSSGHRSCGVEFVLDERVTQGFSGSRQDLYWKIGIALDDVNAATEALSTRLGGQPLSKGSQFEDVGFLMHMRDPVGFPIELLQTTMQQNAAKRRELVQENSVGSDALKSFGQQNSPQPVIGQITIRTNDSKKSLDFYCRELGMTLLCTEDVSQYGFWLYFVGFLEAGEEVPASGGGNSGVSHREWCYQRPYTTLEIQEHVKEERSSSPSREWDGNAVEPRTGSQPRFERESTCEGITLYVPDHATEIELTDPDGLKVQLRHARQFERGPLESKK